MTIDQDSNVVYISNLLKNRFSETYASLNKAVTAAGFRVKELKPTNDIWCRDYMPLQVGFDKFVQFDCNPSYLVGSEHTITDVKHLIEELGINVSYSKLKLDG